MRYRLPQLPIRLWLGLALVAIVVLPVTTTWGVYSGAMHWENARLMSAAAYLTHNAGRWSDPKWQTAAKQHLQALGMDVQLTDPHRLLIFSTDIPYQPFVKGQDGSFTAPDQPNSTARGILTVRIDDTSGGAEHPLAWATLYYAPSPEHIWGNALLAGLIVFLLTLGIVAWFLGRSVVYPLAAMSRAVRGMADGDLAVRLPSSQAREVAEVAAALEAMGSALRESVAHQAALEQERRLFVGAIAHDLRTPLFALRGYLEGLDKGLASTPEKAARYVAICREKADALERLIADLFAYAKVDYMEQAPRREPVNPGILLQQVVESFIPQAVAKGVSVYLAGAEQNGTLEGDAHLLGRALENLLDNALRHTPRDGQIEVSLGAVPPGTLVVTVADTGPGIAAQDLPHLFAPLYRGEASRNRRTGGIGLGLTIARRIVQAHGGDLAAANRPEGGAIFTVTIPSSTRTPVPGTAIPRAG